MAARKSLPSRPANIASCRTLDDRLEFLDLRVGGGGQEDLFGASIAVDGLAFDQSLLLESVQQPDHGGPFDLQHRRQLGLVDRQRAATDNAARARATTSARAP